jgi:hypothetical protein
MKSSQGVDHEGSPLPALPLNPAPAATGRYDLLLRGSIILASISYVFAFTWVYVDYLSTAWEYYGFKNSSPGVDQLLIAFVVAALPSLWMPIHLQRPSNAIYWVLYLTVFVPSCIVPTYVGLQPPSQVLAFILTLLLGFSIVGVSCRLRPLRLSRSRVSGLSFGVMLWSVTGMLTVWVFSTFFGTFQIVSIDDVYSVRLPFIDAAKGTGVSYAVMWLTGAFFPFLTAVGLWRKKPFWILAGAAGLIFIYSIAAFKSAIAFLVVLPALYVLAGKNGRGFGPKMVWMMLIVTVCLYGFYLLIETTDLEYYVFYGVSIFYVRTLGLPGLFSAQYPDFFSDHPLTYFSHINAVGAFIDYPYSSAIGYEIAAFYQAVPDVQSNTHFWCADGIAALGLPGVIVISFVELFVLWILDSVSQDLDPRFATLAVSYGIIALANTSLFTALLSGGLGITILLLYFFPIRNQQQPGTDLSR